MITTTVDHSNLFGDARDQGIRLTCLAFAVSDISTFHHKSDELSVEYLCHHAANNTPGWSGEGFALNTVVDAVENEGQPYEYLYPYSTTNTLKPLDVPPIGLTPLFKANVNSVSMIFDQIVGEVDQGNCVGIIIGVTQSLYSPLNGVVAHDVNALIDTYHALIVTGYGLHQLTSERYIKVRNSWGNSWGIEGYAWLPKSLVDLHLVEAFKI